MDESHKVIRYSPIPKHITEDDIRKQLKDLKVKKVVLTDKAAYAQVEDFQQDIVGFMYDDGHFADWDSNVDFTQEAWDEFQVLKDQPKKQEPIKEDKLQSEIYSSFREAEQSQTYEIPLDSPGKEPKPPIEELKPMPLSQDITKPKQSMVLPSPAETKTFVKPQPRPFEKKQQVPVFETVPQSPALPDWIWPLIFVTYFLWMIFL